MIFVCSWCDAKAQVFITIPTERPMFGCSRHAHRLVPLVRLRMLEIGL